MGFAPCEMQPIKFNDDDFKYGCFIWWQNGFNLRGVNNQRIVIYNPNCNLTHEEKEMLILYSSDKHTVALTVTNYFFLLVTGGKYISIHDGNVQFVTDRRFVNYPWFGLGQPSLNKLAVKNYIEQFGFNYGLDLFNGYQL
jgi:cephalosporin hydroxylase